MESPPVHAVTEEAESTPPLSPAADPSNPLFWMDRIDTDIVELLPYAFCKRHGVVAIGRDPADGMIDVICVCLL